PAGNLRASTDYGDAIPGAAAVVIIVPLSVNSDVQRDFAWMYSAPRDVAANLTVGTLVTYETTLPVGTTRTRWKPMLEEGSRPTEGTRLHLLSSLERVLTAHAR